ncbi:hypothetical protein NYZ99_05080 [Maribacter litopenaei]|uniref:Uncharacterized protein n=1 Tax=Maribacter litopenaei TaxID=2976127 RepID=A0ABY5Y9R0_9FLAO|nr:hypothetical protein [Maribacter litopenaei]UWX55795.1 hypothetical protein NYZ99_05080 [Maribacter litopenaei]
MDKIKKIDFKISYKGNLLPIEEFYYYEDERIFTVCPDLENEKMANAYEYLFTEQDSAMVSDLKYSYGHIRDTLGNKLDERKWEYIHQYREFFVQEATLGHQLISENEEMAKNMPLDSPKQPVLRDYLEGNYWMNTPLPDIQN